MILEFAEGGTLRSLMKNRFESKKDFLDLEVSTIIKNILNALLYLHKRNIIHRDIKPGIYFL